MTERKAEILTEAEVEREALSLQELDKKFGGEIKVDCFVIWQSKALSTIRQMAGLLEEVLPFIGGWNGYEQRVEAIKALLARYKGERQ